MFALGFATAGVLALGFAGPRVLCNSDTSGSGTSEDRGTAVTINRSIILSLSLFTTHAIQTNFLPNGSRKFANLQQSLHVVMCRLRDTKTSRTLVFLTNQFGLPAATICALYKSRWQVELFFKWIKQHLRIKRFFGTSENAVKTQIWIAVSVYVLVAIVKKRLTLDASLYTLLQILSVTLFEKIPMDQALAGNNPKDHTSQITNQLNLFTY
jgi:hypothetical protein